MGSSSDLVDRLDFNVGLEFQEEIRQRLRSPVHHPLPTPDGSFFLLATFRRFLFRLTEDSVSLALQSCLGGHASDFHVKFLSNNHFRFSVFSKDVGFQVYKLRRVITSSFDVYFHLWNNGTPHWEREKRAWEIEQEKEWTKVLSRSAKREAKMKENMQKRVSFACKIVQSPPKVKSQPRISIPFGSFTAQIDPARILNIFPFRVGGTSPETHRKIHNHRHDQPLSGHSNGQPQAKAPFTGARVHHSNSKVVDQSATCSRCLGTGHYRWACKSRIRCARCYNFGHIRRLCRKAPKPIWQWLPKSIITESQPKIVWRPKTPLQPSQSQTDRTEASMGKKPLDCGNDISLEDLVQDLQSDSSSSSSSDASSGPDEDMARFMATHSHCATISLFHRRGIPSTAQPGAFPPRSENSFVFKPILIDFESMQDQVVQHEAAPSSGLEIVLWRPCLHAIALQLWPDMVEARSCANRAHHESTLSVQDVSMEGSRSLILEGGTQGPQSSGPSAFEFQMSHTQPGPSAARGRKKRVTRAANVVSLPMTVADPSSHLVEGSVRRSTRINKPDGYRIVRLDTKKRKPCPIMIDENTGETAPVSLETLRGWGIKCGVAPGELSDEALMQAPSNIGENEEASN